MKEKANYGNWVPEKALYMLFGAAIILGIIAVAVQAALGKTVIAIVVGVLCIVTLVMEIYMLICHETFAFGKGYIQSKHGFGWNRKKRVVIVGSGWFADQPLEYESVAYRCEACKKIIIDYEQQEQ